MPLLFATVVLASAAGCGGNGDATAGSQVYSVEADTTMTTATPPIDKAQFVKRVNRICRHAWSTALRNWDTYRAAQNPRLSERALFVKTARVSLLGALDFHIFDNIYQLGAPPSQEREIEAIIGPMQSAVERGWKGFVPLSSVRLIAELFTEYNRRAHRYGLDDCLIDEAHLRKLEA